MPKKLMKKDEQNRKNRDADFRKMNRLEVAHLVRDEGVAGSNPATPTNQINHLRIQSSLTGTDMGNEIPEFVLL